MSYTPTEWESTDVVTATRMNALEQAVGDMNMSYTPNVWSDGDVLSADKMNALEQAVASGGGGSSDFSTAEVTVRCVAGETKTDGLMCVVENDGITTSYYGVGLGRTETFTVPLYKGECLWMTIAGVVTLVSGSATIDPDYYDATITGDCTLEMYEIQH